MSELTLTPAGNACSLVPGLTVRPNNADNMSYSLSPFETLSGGDPGNAPSASTELTRQLKRQTLDREPELGDDAAGRLNEHEPLEAREVRRAPTPEDPSQSEIEHHKLTGHPVFRSWCRHCVRGRGRDAAHSSTEKAETSLPVLSWDYSSTAT